MKPMGESNQSSSIAMAMEIRGRPHTAGDE